jgi:periplasmic protein TonB
MSRATRRSPAGVLASVVLHLLIGGLLFLRIREDFERVLDAGRQGAGARGGGGGGAGRVAYITLPAPSAAPRVAVTVEPPTETPPPVPVIPAPTPPPVIPPPAPEVHPLAVAAPSATPTGDSVAGVGPGQGGGEGGGTGGGVGPGIGPGRGPGEGTGGGAGGSGRAPRPRYELIPPQDPPKELRGKEVRILFAIDAEGKVRRVTFDPEIPRGKFADRLKETMQDYRFHPALGPDGKPVPGTFEYTMILF